MQWLDSTYTLRFNSRHRKRGHLFQGRYKALLVEAGDERYFLTVSDYVHLNPLRAGLVGGATEAEKWRRFWGCPWSSAAVLGRISGSRPLWLESEAVFHAMGIERDNARGRRLFRETLEERWGDASLRESWKAIRRGWAWGGVEFREKLLKRLGEMKGRAKERNWSGTLVEESEENRAERLYARGIEVLRELGQVDERGFGGKLDWRRQWLAWWIFGRSRVTLEWVASRVGMGHESNVSHAWKNMEARVKREPILQKLARVAENPKSKD